MSSGVIISTAQRRLNSLARAPFGGWKQRIRIVTSVMEAKAHLLKCISPLSRGMTAVPAFIVVDTGTMDRDIKRELDCWLAQHPALDQVEVLLAADWSHMERIASAIGRFLRLW